MKKKSLIVLLLLLLLGAGAWYYRRPAEATPESTLSPDRLVAKAEKRDIDFSIDVSGDVIPLTQLEIKAEVGGRIKALHVEAGQVVKQGELLVEIDDRDLLTEKDSVLTEIEGAKLTVDLTTKKFNRGKELFEAKLISIEDFDDLSSQHLLAQNSLTKAERKLQLTEDKLIKTKVIAPSDGTVLTLPVIEGQVIIAAASVNSGTSLMTIADLSKLLVESQINQVDVARLEVNKTAVVRAESLRDLEMEAKIFFIAPKAEAKNNVKGFLVRALISKPNARLRPGMTVNMTVPVAHVEDAVSVPISAVFKGEGNSRVVYVRNGENPERREVKIGVSNFDHAQIIKGVAEGEEILLIEPNRTPGLKKS